MNLNDDIYRILASHFEDGYLHGYLGGSFNSENDKLFATTLVELDSIDYGDFEYLHSTFNGYAGNNYDIELAKKWTSENTYQYRSATECIEEGIYKYFSITFSGILFKSEWFIQPSLTYYGDQTTWSELESMFEQIPTPGYWEQSMFKPKEPFFLYHPDGDRNREPMKIREEIFEEFSGEPQLVAWLKQAAKEKVNNAYVAYFHLDIIEPLFTKLRTQDPEHYKAMSRLTFHYPCIFPKHKNYTLFACMAQSDNLKWRLEYFVHDRRVDKCYLWSYFSSEQHEETFFYSDLIIADLQQISHWNDMGFLNSSCTMDDENFWANSVFSKKDGAYPYLTELP